MINRINFKEIKAFSRTLRVEADKNSEAAVLSGDINLRFLPELGRTPPRVLGP